MMHLLGGRARFVLMALHMTQFVLNPHLGPRSKASHGEACEARQESGPPEKSEDGAEMRYNDRGHTNTPSGRWGW